MSDNTVPRCGDRVLHKPTGEHWIVSFCDPARDELSWLGWPDGVAKLSECELVERCSDDEHARAVAQWMDLDSRRAQRVFDLYGLALVPAEIRKQHEWSEAKLVAANKAQAEARDAYFVAKQACVAAIKAREVTAG